jgi:PHD/YefM family antitoxin component YafN of YafNO toxin-antitoxin module
MSSERQSKAARMRVSSSEFIRDYRKFSDKALAEPVVITSGGRDRLVVIAAAEYERLKRRDRRVIEAGELDEGQLDAIAKAEVPAEYAHLDAELDR